MLPRLGQLRMLPIAPSQRCCLLRCGCFWKHGRHVQLLTSIWHSSATMLAHCPSACHQSGCVQACSVGVAPTSVFYNEANDTSSYVQLGITTNNGATQACPRKDTCAATVTLAQSYPSTLPQSHSACGMTTAHCCRYGSRSSSSVSSSLTSSLFAGYLWHLGLPDQLRCSPVSGAVQWCNCRRVHLHRAPHARLPRVCPSGSCLKMAICWWGGTVLLMVQTMLGPHANVMLEAGCTIQWY